MLNATPAAKGFLEEVYRASPEIERIAPWAQDFFSMVREWRLPEIGTVAQLAQGFFRVIRERHVPPLRPWIHAAKQTADGFASRLERDGDAATAALTLMWSQGHVEGQVDRLKLIKGRMYGRPGFHLLRLGRSEEEVLHQKLSVLASFGRLRSNRSHRHTRIRYRARIRDLN